MQPLSVYWSPHHRRPTDYALLRDIQPSVVKIMDGGDNDYLWVRQNLPDALILARDWAMSEQKENMLRDPEGTAIEHAQSWNKQADLLGFDRAHTICCGINEPSIWEPGVTEALNRYTIRFLDECTKHQLRGSALHLSVGWPDNTGPDTPPNWNIFTGVEAAILRGNHCLVLHEYWADEGPEELLGWWALRFVKCPWQVPIVIGECGIEMAVKDGGPHRGWQGIKSADAYAHELVRYAHMASQDKRLYGVCAYMLDYADGEWASFDIEPIRNNLLGAGVLNLQQNVWFPHQNLPTVPPELPEIPSLPSDVKVVRPLKVGTYSLTQHFYQNPQNYAQFGMPGHNGTDFGAPTGTPVCSIADGIVQWVDTDGDYGNYIRVFHPALNCHSFYAHLSAQHVTLMDTVHAGQVIGQVGNTGNSTGPHLHLEVRVCDKDGNYSVVAPMPKGRLDPETWFALLGISLSTGVVAKPPEENKVFLPIIST